MDCNCEGYIGRVYRVISEAYPSTARSRIKSSFLLLSQQYFMNYILYNCNNFVIYKIITIIVIILDPCVLKHTWNWRDNAVKDNGWSRIDRHDWKLAESQFNLTAITLITVVWTQNVIKLRHVSYCNIKIIIKRNKQQSLAGRIDKLGGPEFENHCPIPWSWNTFCDTHVLPPPLNSIPFPLFVSWMWYNFKWKWPPSPPPPPPKKIWFIMLLMCICKALNIFNTIAFVKWLIYIHVYTNLQP